MYLLNSSILYFLPLSPPRSLPLALSPSLSPSLPPSQATDPRFTKTTARAREWVEQMAEAAENVVMTVACPRRFDWLLR